MDITKELQEATSRRQQIIEEVNALAERRQELLAEAIRLEGEIRVLQRLSEPSPEAAADAQKRPK